MHSDVHVTTPTQKYYADLRRARLKRFASAAIKEDRTEILYSYLARDTLPPIPNEMIEEACAIALADEAKDIPDPPTAGQALRVDMIQRAVVKRFPDVTITDVKSARRTANVVKPRQIAMYLCKTLTLRSLPDIGRRFGGRDHTTVLHAVRKISTLVKQNPDSDLARLIDAIRASLSCAAEAS